MKGSDRNKLILVVVIFALAAAVFLWQYRTTLFGSAGVAPATPPSGQPNAGTGGAVPAEEPQPANQRVAPGR